MKDLQPKLEIPNEIVVLLEDEAPIRKGFKDIFEDMDIGLSLLPCSNFKEYEAIMNDENSRKKIRALIIDLSNLPAEDISKEYKAADYIHQEFTTNRVPIFIHSSNLNYYDQFREGGTVFRIEKKGSSTNDICERIKLMYESDFLNIFRIEGTLQEKIMDEVHSAFTSQFKGDEIESIIKSVQESKPDDLKKRTTEVFERIAIRAVYENWISAKIVDDSIHETKLNAIEHYYSRTSDYELWTGDIFCKNDSDSEHCIVLTPRCNVGHQNMDEVLLCKVLPIHEEALNQYKSPKKGKEGFRKSITDDVTNKLIGEKSRFLPPVPQFKGGFVDFSTMFTLIPSEFLKSYSLVITLSDELTNDVVRKYSNYVLRGGISETEFSEAYYYVKNLIEESEDKTEN